ncbi:hypothetical protein ACFOHU_13565 [Ottowia pentelensis]|uniref:Type II secretion system protein GspC N-terminal domain-containing protein n=1 Tax=Ottowia pentelensis TaxID=511108 RepID=A0ABV6PR28_9BURK
MSRLVAPIYLVAVGLMAVLLFMLWAAPGPLAAWRHWQPPPPQPPRLDDVQAAMLRPNPLATGAYPVVLDRPLFTVTRRPAAAAAAAAPAAAPAPSAIEQLALQGVVAGPTLTGVMLQEGGQTRFVRVGERVDDWVLARVQDREAVFERGGRQHRIAFNPAPGEAATSGRAAAVPMPAAAATPVVPPAAVPAAAPNPPSGISDQTRAKPAAPPTNKGPATLGGPTTLGGRSAQRTSP